MVPRQPTEREYTDRERAVLELIDADELVALTCALVAAGGENPGGSEAETARVLGAAGSARDLRVGHDVVVPGLPNVDVELAPGGAVAGGPGLLFLGHSDVVPAGPGWTRDPFRPTVEDGRIHGRGTTDMKGGLTAVLASMAALRRAGAALGGPVRLDPATAPDQVFRLVESMGARIAEAPDPVILPKAAKNPAEIAGMRAAHLRDGAAVTELLCWLDRRAPRLEDEPLTEIGVARKLEELRMARGILDISFDTISATGPHGAICHYRVSADSDLRILPGQVLLAGA